MVYYYPLSSDFYIKLEKGGFILLKKLCVLYRDNKRYLKRGGSDYVYKRVI